MSTQERRARLEHFCCPEHGVDLVEEATWDEHGCHVVYWCFPFPEPAHTIGSVYDHASGEYWPVEEAG